VYVFVHSTWYNFAYKLSHGEKIMKPILGLALLTVFVSCGPAKQDTPLSNCATEQIEEGVKFICTDASGEVTTGIVKHGERGAVGEKGETGETGPAGPGLLVKKEVTCSGKIEGWLENSHYAIDYQQSTFETGDRFAWSVVAATLGETPMNKRHASMFVLKSMPDQPLANGLVEMELKGKTLHVQISGRKDVVEIPCYEVAK
jgi:hypothetical protein